MNNIINPFFVFYSTNNQTLNHTIPTQPFEEELQKATFLLQKGTNIDFQLSSSQR